ncbi:tetraacyldisaccharide 4'-kinase [Rhizobacter sp. Root1221]|uniref:tetraacyldisaccharide 4'-kinase n=1 Tax=Rhizobacter sp. Root1221 TaxID=1736433 RepID=UPI0006FC8CDE|nr:tetraacyldisaccharide 4'-kinase [Rhizobacter sp. Root1221]KQV85650.1 tetraacyldisaccharide 4'-kinase [Rhizobacter sp. Root1221]
MRSPTFATRLQAAWLRRGPLAVVLWPVSVVYRAVYALRTLAHAAGWVRTERLPVPVIVVGNLVAGGAGKTPTTLALVELLRRHGYTPGLVSRGFGRTGGDVRLVTAESSPRDVGDEPLLMHLRSLAPVAVGRDRAAAGRALLAAHPTIDVLVSDDGLQHVRLGRDVQVIVFDERGAGNGWLLPAGPLREPFRRNPPARTLVVYNAPAPSTPWPGHAATRGLRGVVDLTNWWRGAPATRAHLAALCGRPVVAAAGVARPGRFFGMLHAAGLEVKELPLPDHHDFATIPWPHGTPDVVVTEKDAVKLRPAACAGTRVHVATLDFALGPAFEAELFRLLPHRPRA